MAKQEEVRKNIQLYMLDKIVRSKTIPVRAICEMYGVSENTVHRYTRELIESGKIRKIKRAEYELVTQKKEYILYKNKGEYEEEMDVYQQYIYPHVKNLSSNVEHIWAYGFSEMMNNVIDHSESKEVYIKILQNYMYTTVVLHDLGIGIFRKLCDYFKFTTYEDAICELFKGKITTDKSKHSGEGIFFTSKMMDEFWIASEDKIFQTNKFEYSETNDLDINTKGTKVCMTLSNFTNRKPMDVFNQFSSVDDGFTTTVIPLAKIFDSVPVSRSQAKRVCSRLELFKNVEVNCQDIEWMGQGFADQVFRVFANQHPNIHIYPTNMDEEIANMYQHIMNTKNE